MRKMTTNRCRPARRHGAAAVEFALIAPLMLLFTFGMIEISRMMMVKNAATQASREGARVAVLPGSESADVRTRVQEELTLMSIDVATIELDPEIISNAPPGSNVTVRVRVNPDDVSWVPSFLTFTIPEISATSVMRRESTN